MVNFECGVMNVELPESEFRTLNIAHSKFNIYPRLAFSLRIAPNMMSREDGPTP